MLKDSYVYYSGTLETAPTSNREAFSADIVLVKQFINFMIKLCNWSTIHNCEIGISTNKDTIIVTFTKKDLRIKRAFDISTLVACDEMLILTELENAFDKLIEGGR